jgi:hypothetical protein
MAELHNLDPNRPNLCSWLRTKGMFIGGESDLAMIHTETGIFWCSQTQGPLGPDGQLAEPGNCDNGDRRCHCQEITLA